MKYTAVKGMHDLLPPATAQWVFIESTMREIFGRYGFAEIRTPIVEKMPLFVRSVGQTTDLVEKEMYTFIDQGEEALTLRPEGTAPVVRAYVEHSVHQKDPLAKYYYFGPMFRRERPQKGRYRQFHQIGVELLGAAHPFADAEAIVMLVDFLKTVGLRDVRLEVNSIGCRKCRPRYNADLQHFLQSVAGQLCEDCRRRMVKNPQRVFDCKETRCQQALTDAPTIQDFWCEECSEHFTGVCNALDAQGVQYWINHRIARGLDYYMRTAFEVVTHIQGAQNAICGGGRYDGLVEDLGGPDTAGVGFAIGVERLLMLLEAQEQALPIATAPPIYFALLGEGARRAALPMLAQLRAQRKVVEWDYDGRSLKSQMKRADRLNASHVVIIGDDELGKEEAMVRDMATKEQIAVPFTQLVTHLQGKADAA